MIPFRQATDGRLADSVTNRILAVASRIRGARPIQVPEQPSDVPNPFTPILPAGFTRVETPQAGAQPAQAGSIAAPSGEPPPEVPPPGAGAVAAGLTSTNLGGLLGQLIAPQGQGGAQ